MSIRSSSSPEPLNVEVFPSSYLRAALIALALLIAFALLRSAIPTLVQMVLILAVFAWTLNLLRRHTGLWGRADCSALFWDGAGWIWRRGDEHDPVLLRRATIWPGFVLLDFRGARDGGRRVLLLLPDSAAKDALRRLRVYLRHLPVFCEQEDAG